MPGIASHMNDPEQSIPARSRETWKEHLARSPRAFIAFELTPQWDSLIGMLLKGIEQTLVLKRFETTVLTSLPVSQDEHTLWDFDYTNRRVGFLFHRWVYISLSICCGSCFLHVSGYFYELFACVVHIVSFIWTRKALTIHHWAHVYQKKTADQTARANSGTN